MKGAQGVHCATANEVKNRLISKAPCVISQVHPLIITYQNATEMSTRSEQSQDETL